MRTYSQVVAGADSMLRMAYSSQILIATQLLSLATAVVVDH